MHIERRLLPVIALAMLAFAANSLLCRLALKNTGIDAASFTTLRLCSGALVLALLVRWRGGSARAKTNWLAALALFMYAAAFSFAYIKLPAAAGALLLFGAVQITMIGTGLWRGERLHGWQLPGFLLAIGGLLYLLAPGLGQSLAGDQSLSLSSALLMLLAGFAWGVYSLQGKQQGDPTRATAGNFLRAVPLTLVLSVLTLDGAHLDALGVAYALASGGIASGIGYALWYYALPGLTATNAATLQLSVPVLAAVGAVFFLGEPLTWRLLASSIAILGGIALVIVGRRAQR